MTKLSTCPRCAALRLAGFDDRCTVHATRSRAAMRTHRGFKVPVRMERRAKRWTLCAEQRKRCGGTELQIVRRVYALHEELLPHFSWEMITKNGLDNPYMTGSARRTLINDVLRYRSAAAGRKKKPVQSVRTVPAIRRAA